ncbi:MAG: F0F1 ATP synthase subunit delta [Cellvibrionales bacterium TMED148]|nr:F0F1 ATP synthase subunit delta [Porticoccaceae bacterium]RPG92886.1 MAG: F0F1 ATP synthase subunit delta [Cellvibrionales bacterium TMED148]
MAELHTLARPYARAAFEVACDSADLGGWSRRLALLGRVTQEPSIIELLSSPSLTGLKKASVLKEICGDDLDKSIENFLLILSENRRLQLMVQIAQQFEIMKANHEKAIDVDILAARQLEDEQLNKLNSVLAKKLGRKINMQVQLDQNLLGGVVIRAGDTIIDGSIRGRLTKLADSLNI